MKTLFKASDLSNTPSRKRSTLLQAMGAYINTGIAIVQGLLLIPLYLHYIGAHTYGIWLASGGMLGMLGLMNFGISSLIVQRVSRSYAHQDFAKAVAYFTNGVFIYLGISLLYAVAGWIASIWLPEILKVIGEDAELLIYCFQIAVLAMVLGIFNECMRSFAQALLRPLVPMLSMAAGRILGIGVTVGMLFYDFGLWAIPMGMLIAEGVTFILNFFYTVSILRRLATKMSLDRKILNEYMRTSPALLMARMGNTLSQESEPLLITIFLSPEVTTAYMVTRKAADIVSRMLQVITGSTMGSCCHLVGSGDNKKTSRIAKKLLFLSFSAGTIGFVTYVGANHAFVPLWVGESLVLDYDITLFIALGFFASTFRGLLGQMLYGLGDFVHTSIVILLEGITRIALAVGLLSTLGVVGVPLAFTLSCLIAMVALGSRLRRKLAMSFDIPEMVRFLLSGAVLFGASINLLQVQMEIDSWSGFALYLAILMFGVVTMYTLMNWTRCRDIYRSIVA